MTAQEMDEAYSQKSYVGQNSSKVILMVSVSGVLLIVPNHAGNQLTDISRELRSARARLQLPEQFESSPMPSDQCLGFDDHQS